MEGTVLTCYAQSFIDRFPFCVPPRVPGLGDDVPGLLLEVGVSHGRSRLVHVAWGVEQFCEEGGYARRWR